MCRLCWILVLGGFALAPALAPAAIIHVPGDQPTIQAGIDAAVDGDTVLVSDGVYTGAGNRDLDFAGREITVRSAGGPLACIIDCNGNPSVPHRGFHFHSGEGNLARVEGFTIKRGRAGYGGSILCEGSSPTIAGCVLTDNVAEEGAGVALFESSALILDCHLQNNRAFWGGSGILARDSTPVIAGTVFDSNGEMVYGELGGGMRCRDSAATIGNCLFVGNRAYYGGGLHVTGAAESFIYNSTFTLNTAMMDGCGVFGTHASFINCIIWDNPPDNIWPPSGGSLTISWSDAYDWWGNDWPGEGNINQDPLFVSGPQGSYYLSQTAAGQTADSPCLNAGSAPAGSICLPGLEGTICLDQMTTRTDQVSDGGTVDMGYHDSFVTISAGLTCIPSWGYVPFLTQMTATLSNLHAGGSRRLAGRIDIALAGGFLFSNCRSGYTNVAPGASFVTSWGQAIPAIPMVIGPNAFRLIAEDVTPYPYNQPPDPPSGDAVEAVCTVRGVEP